MPPNNSLPFSLPTNLPEITKLLLSNGNWS
jgi:hypothetical protein